MNNNPDHALENQFKNPDSLATGVIKPYDNRCDDK